MGDSSSPASVESDPLTEEFEKAKDTYPKRDGDQRWQKAFGHFRAARRKGEPLDSILDGLRRYAAWCERKGLVGTDKVKQAATFFGPEKCWREPWEAPERPYTPA